MLVCPEESDQRRMLRDTIAVLLAETFDFARRREILASPEGWDRRLWQELAELGMLRAGFPPEAGGLGGDIHDMMVIAEELGRGLVVSPYLPAVVFGGGILAGLSAPSARDLLEQVLAGGAVVLPVSDAAHRPSCEAVAEGHLLRGEIPFIRCLPWASHLLVEADSNGAAALLLVDQDRSGASSAPFQTHDGFRGGTLRLDGCRLPAEALVARGDGAAGLVDEARELARLALCAEAVGVMRRLLAEAIAHVRQRRQFGRALAELQAVRHRIADMHLAVEATAALVAVAADAPAGADRRRAVSAAKVQANGACRSVGQGAVQLHGGLGLSDEASVSHAFRRATAIEAELGDRDFHLVRYQEIG